MSESSPKTAAETPQPVVGGSVAPPVPQYRRKGDASTSMVLLALVVLVCGWVLMSYLDVSCLGFDLRDFIPRRNVGGVEYVARTERTTPQPPSPSSRDSDTRSVAAEAKNSVRDFFEQAGNFHCPQPERYTHDEVAQHHTADDLWVVIDGNVLDVSVFINQHPGGLVLLDGAGGQDMATVFARFHHPSSVDLFTSFCIGRIAEP